MRQSRTPRDPGTDFPRLPKDVLNVTDGQMCTYFKEETVGPLQGLWSKGRGSDVESPCNQGWKRRKAKPPKNTAFPT